MHLVGHCASFSPADKSTTSSPRRRCLRGIDGGAVIADKAYDSNHLRQLIANAGMLAVIPSIPSRKVPIPHDANLYKNRNRIERCFNKLKHFRRFATRFDRRAAHFLAFIQLACAMIWMR
jgi:transposase